MSSIIDRPASTTGLPSNGQATSNIIQFDATVRRKERMRKRAAGQPARGDTAGNNGPAARDAVPTPPAVAPADFTIPAHEGNNPPKSTAQPPETASLSPSTEAGTTEPAATATSPAELEAYLVAFVVEQTGYPQEMVELDADLEADLGIDSIKKAQLFGELAEQFRVDIQGAEDLSLDDFPTLRHVMQFLQAASPEATTSVAAPPANAQTAAITAEEQSPRAERPGPDVSPGTPKVKPEPSTSFSKVGALSGTGLERFLIGFVVEQTGYPEEMVELDADLEADLGIDSIKKAQLFGELAEQFDLDIQSANDLSLDDFPTLRHVLSFLEGGTNHADTAGVERSEAGSRKSEMERAHRTSAFRIPHSELEAFLIDFVVEQTGYPQEMVELDADLEADLGIDSIKKAQLFGELAEQFDINIQSADDLSLDDFTTLRDVMNFLEGSSRKEESPVTPSSPAPAPNVDAPAASSILSPPSAPEQPATASKPATASEREAAPASAMNSSELEDFLVNFVVDQTGYPPEMVELDADLEADLGIDSIKKAQLFGELAEQFEVNIQAEAAQEMSLDDYPTLRHVMSFLEGVPQKATV